MSVEVKCFDEHKVKQELKKCPKIVQEYVKLLNESLKRQQELTARAIGKIRELSSPKTDTINER